MSKPRIDFLYLSEPDMIKAGVTDMAKCVDTMEEVLMLLSKGDYRMGGKNGNSHGVMMSFPEKPEFPGMPCDGPDKRFMAMPAYIGGSFQMAGMKWYGSNVENRKDGIPRSILMVALNEPDTGIPLAYMSGNLISSYRTGAIPGVGTKLFAKPDSKVCGFFGPGVMSRTALAAFAATCPNLDTVKIKGRGQASIDSFVSFVKEKYPQFKTIQVVDNVEELVKDSDVLCFASTSDDNPSTYPMVKEEWIKPGAVITCPSAVNFEDDFLINKARLVVDNKKLYEAWADEYPYPTFGTVNIVGSKFTDLVHDGKLDWDNVDNIGDVVSGVKPGRTSDDEIIVYSVGGMPVEDVAWGKIIYENAKKLGIGTLLNLWETPELA